MLSEQTTLPVSEQRIQQTPRLIAPPPNAPRTPENARDLCQRAGSDPYLSGSISSPGSQNVLGFKAVNILTGHTLAEEQKRATDRTSPTRSERVT